MSHGLTRGSRLYLVQRLGWSVSEHEGRPECFRHDEDGGVPVRAFTTQKAANACKRQLDAEACRELNPFQFESRELEYLTSLGEDGFLEGVRQLGLEPPTPAKFPFLQSDELIDYAAWWDAVAESLTDRQREGVWAMLDKLTLYTVVSTEIKG